MTWQVRIVDASGLHSDGSWNPRLGTMIAYKVFLLSFDDSCQVKDEKLKTITVAGRKGLDCVTHGRYPFLIVKQLNGIQKLVIDVVGNQWSRKSTEILLEKGGNGVNVKIGIRDVEIVAPFEAFFDALDLTVAATFAVDAFDIHA